MHFENVSALIEALGPEAVKMSFHWRDAKGPICNQNAVFRVNCMDCLDRTNVVQTAMGRAVLESQLVKVGLMPPYSQVSIVASTIGIGVLYYFLILYMIILYLLTRFPIN